MILYAFLLVARATEPPQHTVDCGEPVVIPLGTPAPKWDWHRSGHGVAYFERLGRIMRIDPEGSIQWTDVPYELTAVRTDGHGNVLALGRAGLIRLITDEVREVSATPGYSWVGHDSGFVRVTDDLDELHLWPNGDQTRRSLRGTDGPLRHIDRLPFEALVQRDGTILVSERQPWWTQMETDRSIPVDAPPPFGDEPSMPDRLRAAIESAVVTTGVVQALRWEDDILIIHTNQASMRWDGRQLTRSDTGGDGVGAPRPSLGCSRVPPQTREIVKGKTLVRLWHHQFNKMITVRPFQGPEAIWAGDPDGSRDGLVPLPLVALDRSGSRLAVYRVQIKPSAPAGVVVFDVANLGPWPTVDPDTALSRVHAQVTPRGVIAWRGNELLWLPENGKPSLHHASHRIFYAWPHLDGESIALELAPAPGDWRGQTQQVVLDLSTGGIGPWHVERQPSDTTIRSLNASVGPAVWPRPGLGVWLDGDGSFVVCDNGVVQASGPARLRGDPAHMKLQVEPL